MRTATICLILLAGCGEQSQPTAPVPLHATITGIWDVVLVGVDTVKGYYNLWLSIFILLLPLLCR